MCGSIGLDSQVEHLGIPGVISGFEPHTVGALPRTEASELIWKLSTGGEQPLVMTQEIADRMLERTGWLIPNYLQLLYHFLSELKPDLRSNEFPAPIDVDAAYEELTSRDFASKFAPWDTRLNEGFIDPHHARLARHSLDLLCHKPEGFPTEDLFQLLLSKHPNDEVETLREVYTSTLRLLERDGYVIIENRTVAYRSPILRDYWRNRYLL